MSKRLPRLRLNLDFLPSPVEDRPGLLIRDSQGYSDVMLVIPPALVACLQLLDGEHTDLDLKAELARITGQIEVSEVIDQMLATLSNAGFLHDDVYHRMREAREKEFLLAPALEANHAGSAYPAERDELRSTLKGYMDGGPESLDGNLLGIAAPHVSPFGGIKSYRAAYSALPDKVRDKTFVVLGTSHQGEPGHYGLTRKPFDTPFGKTRTELAIVDRLAARRAARMEDFCFASEHSIEFQVIFLQHLFGAEIKVVPVLCGTLLGISEGSPERNEDVRAFVNELGEVAAKEGERLVWVLGIDMAHMGRRYGDPYSARADEGRMLEVAARDRERIDQVNRGDAAGFWSLVEENGDDLKWCGSSPLYTFLKAVPEVRGTLREYQHWNIDQNSVVSFGALAFSRG